MIGNFNSGNPFGDSRPMPGEDSRISGPYEGQYLDAEQEVAWAEAATKQAEYFSYVDAYTEKYIVKNKNKNDTIHANHVVWALRILAKASMDLDNSKDENQEMLIRQMLEDVRQRNPELFLEAEQFIKEQDEIVAKAFVELMKKATDALLQGDKGQYLLAEEMLHHTNPIPTEAIRAKLQADRKFID